MKWHRKLFHGKDSQIGIGSQIQNEESSSGIDIKSKASKAESKDNDSKKKHKGKKQKRSLPFRIPLGISVASSTSNSSTSKDSRDDDMPRISMQLTMAELQEEAFARGIEKQYLPTTKRELLDFLVDGSIHLRKTDAWKDVEALKSKMEVDCRRIEQEKRQNESEERDQFPLTPPNNNQKDGHYSGNMSHPYKLSKGEESLLDMSSMQSTLQSTVPSTLATSRYTRGLERDNSFRTSEESVVGDWRIFPIRCGLPLGCGVGACKTKDELHDEEHELDLKEIQSKDSIDMLLKHNIQWDASLQFDRWIIIPSHKNKRPKGNSLKGFTVWCSVISRGQIFPVKHFDTTYRNLADANDRARYLFYWKNPWKLSPTKMVETVFIKSDTSANNESANTFHCAHPNGDKW